MLNPIFHVCAGAAAPQWSVRPPVRTPGMYMHVVVRWHSGGVFCVRSRVEGVGMIRAVLLRVSAEKVYDRRNAFPVLL